APAGQRFFSARKPGTRARADGADPEACGRGDRHFAVQRARVAAIRKSEVSVGKPAAAAGFAGELWLQVWSAERCGPDVRRALPAQSPLCARIAAVYRAGQQG